MLIEFRVENFKNFKEELIFKLDDVKNYEFSIQAIKDGVVKDSLVYGVNGSGKSNLGLAIFDISANITDKEKNRNYSSMPFLNLFKKKNAKFYYKFKFDSSCLEYKYEKSNFEQIVSEEVYINNNLVISYDHKKQDGFIKLKGTETLNTNLSQINIAFVKYIKSNAVLNMDNETNKVFKKFIDFVDNMLLFSSLENNHYQGFTNGNGTISNTIISKGKLNDFEKFLETAGINYKLLEKNIDDKNMIYCDFDGTEINFYSVASRGIYALALFYNWLIQLDKVSLVFIDEFDAFYHNELARLVIEEVLKQKCQAIITTHNTSIMDNNLLRPDCYFNLVDGEIKSFANSTQKELRKAHNIEKLYRAGSFDE